MEFKVLENQRYTEPTVPNLYVKNSEEILEWARNRDNIAVGDVRVESEDSETVLEQFGDQLHVVDAETRESIQVQAEIMYDQSTLNALDTAQEAASLNNVKPKLVASQNYTEEYTDLENAIQTLNGSFPVTAQKPLEIDHINNEMKEIITGFIDSNRPGTEYGAQLRKLANNQTNYKQAYQELNQIKTEEVQKVQEILERGTGASFENHF